MVASGVPVFMLWEASELLGVLRFMLPHFCSIYNNIYQTDFTTAINALKYTGMREHKESLQT